MAAGSLAETAKLVASLELKDRFTPAANKAMSSLGRLEGTAFRVGQNIGKGLQNAAHNIARIGLVAAAGVAVAVRGGLQSLAELEDATTSVDGAIKQVGLTGKVTSAQVAAWANDIESNIDAAFDDKAITAAATTLIRFGKVTASNLQPALVVMTDLATKTGSVESAASLLARALADPAKAAGKLAKSGVVLTKVQQDQIKELVKAGKVSEAQTFIINELSKATKGAAAAAAGPYRDAMNTLSDSSEDAQRALGIGFLPVIQKVAGLLKTELAKQSTIDNLKAFGQSMAGGLDKLIGIVRNLPWETIGTSLKIAGTGAKAVLDAFTGLPAWVQTAVLTGWGLNKLTGGALTGIVKELGGGLFGHFLERGSSPANPMFVAQVGGLPGIGGGVPGAGGAIPGWSSTAGGSGGLSGLLKGLPMIGIAVIAAQAAQTLANAVLTNAKPLLTDAGVPEPAADIGTNTIGIVTDVLTGHPFDALNRLPDIAAGVEHLASLIKEPPKEPPFDFDQFGKLVAQKLSDSKFPGKERDDLLPKLVPKLQDTFDRAVIPTTDAVKDGTAATTAAGALAASAAQGAGRAAAAAALTGAFITASAVRGARPIITNDIDIDISGTSVVKQASVSTSYGPTTSSREGNLGTFGGNGPR